MKFTSIIILSLLVLVSAVSSFSFRPEEGVIRNMKDIINHIAESRHSSEIYSDSSEDEDEEYKVDMEVDNNVADTLGSAGIIPQTPGLRIYLVDKTIEILSKSIIEVTKEVLKNAEPIKVVGNKTINAEGKTYKITCTLSNAKINHLSRVTVSKMTSNVVNKKLLFALNFPFVRIDETTYELDGRVHGVTIKATGAFSANVTSLDLTASIKYGFDKKNVIQIKKLELHYDFKTLSAAVTNLNIPLVSKEKVNEVVSQIITDYLKKEEKTISKGFATIITERVNHLFRSVA